MRSEVLDIKKTAKNLVNQTVNIPVGPQEEYTTINEALEFLSTRETEYRQAGVKVTITLQSDYVMEEQVLVNDKDLGWITILNDAGSEENTEQVVAFTQGSKISGVEQPEISQVTIGSYTVNDTNFASVLNDNNFLLQAGNGDEHYFWYRVPTKARADLGSVLVTYDNDTGTAGNAYSIETVISGDGTELSASFTDPLITVNLATLASAVQAENTITASQGDPAAEITVAAVAGEDFDGTAGNDIQIYFVDNSGGTGSGNISATYFDDYLDDGSNIKAVEVDFDGTDQTAADIKTVIDAIDEGTTSGSDLVVTINEEGTFTLADDLGGQGSLSGGLDAGDADPDANTPALLVAELDGLTDGTTTFTAVTSGTSPVISANTYDFTGGSDGASDPALSGTGHVIDLTETDEPSTAATETQSVVNALSDFSAEINSSNDRRIDITNTEEASVNDIVINGDEISGGVTQQGVDEAFRVRVNVLDHGFSADEKIVIKDHEGTAEEVDYNGRYTIYSSNVETDSFEIDESDGTVWDSDRAGVSNTAGVYEDVPVTVSRESLTEVWEFFYYPAFGVARGTLPTIGCLFDMDESGDNAYWSYKDGLCATDQGRINVLPGAGFTNAGGTNFYGTRSSTLNGNDGVFDGGKRYGIWAYASTVINARRASAKNCGDPTVGAANDVTGDGYDDTGQSVGSGVVATRSSVINASGITVTGSYGDNIVSEAGSVINLAAHDGGEVYTIENSTVGTNFRTLKGGIITGIGENRDTLKTNAMEINGPITSEDSLVKIENSTKIGFMDSDKTISNISFNQKEFDKIIENKYYRNGIIHSNELLYLFDGSSDNYLDIPPQVLDGLEDFSFSCWFYIFKTMNKTLFPILSVSNSTDANILLIDLRGNLLNFDVDVYFGSDFNQNSRTLYSFEFEKWYNVTFIRNKNLMKSFINGEKIFEKTGKMGGPLSVESIIIGQEQDSVGGGYDISQSMNGFINDIKFWNVPISDEQAKENFYKIERISGNEPGLVAYYPLDEGSGATATDLTSNSYDGTIQDPDRWTETSKKGLFFNNSDAVQSGDETNIQYVEIPHNSVFNVSDVTIEVTIQYEDYNNFDEELWQTILSKGEDQAFQIRRSGGRANGQLEFLIEYSADEIIPNFSPIRIWPGEKYIITVTYNSSNGESKIYLNGFLVSTKTETGATGSIVSNTNPIFIGLRNDSPGIDRRTSWTGIISELKIWNSTLTQEEISSIYGKELTGSETNLIGYWKFNDDPSTDVVIDYAGSNNGIIHNEPISRAITFGPSPFFINENLIFEKDVRFVSSDNTGHIIFNDIKDSYLKNSFTFSGWFNLETNNSTDSVLIAFENQLSSLENDFFIIKRNGTENESLSVTIGGATENIDITGKLNSWFNISVSKDDISNVKVFLDGKVVNEFLAGSTQPVGMPMLIGGNPTIPNSTIDGSISNIKIFAKELSEREVEKNFLDKKSTTTFDNLTKFNEGIISEGFSDFKEDVRINKNIYVNSNSQILHEDKVIPSHYFNEHGVLINYKRPTFRVRYPITPFEKDKSIVFEKVELNIGSHYNTYNGEFYAPYTGVYIFSFSALKYDEATETIDFRIFKNGTRLEGMTLYSHSTETSQNSHSSGSSFFYLNENDIIYVGNINDVNGSTPVSPTHTIFSGLFIG